MKSGQFLAFLGFLTVTNTACGKTGYGPGEQDWGFVDVRNGAHMFYWLYYTTANVSDYTERPLAIWLQGGPGSSSTGEGNFEELGPLDLNGNNRNWTWVKDMNVLFIDSPVGSGFSFVDDINYLTLNNTQIALDLVVFMKEFFNRHPKFVDVPLHIFTESYGGKMAPEFAFKLYNAIQQNEIKCNLTSLVLGDPFTSPIDAVMAWAPFLLNMGIVDKVGYNKIAAAANQTLNFVKQGNWSYAYTQMENTLIEVQTVSKGIDFFNILKRTRSNAFSFMLHSRNKLLGKTYSKLNSKDTDEPDEQREQKLEKLMRGSVSVALNTPSNIKWGAQSDYVFAALTGDIMKPLIHKVSEILDKTNLKVGIYSGQLDFICPTAGTGNWIDNMQWKHRSKYVNAPRLGLVVNRLLEGYEKSGDNFSMFWINRAGHKAVADNPAALSYIRKKFTNYG